MASFDSILDGQVSAVKIQYIECYPRGRTSILQISQVARKRSVLQIPTNIGIDDRLTIVHGLQVVHDPAVGINCQKKEAKMLVSPACQVFYVELHHLSFASQSDVQ